jgi:hypothetical protein
MEVGAQRVNSRRVGCAEWLTRLLFAEKSLHEMEVRVRAAEKGWLPGELEMAYDDMQVVAEKGQWRLPDDVTELISP